MGLVGVTPEPDSRPLETQADVTLIGPQKPSGTGGYFRGKTEIRNMLATQMKLALTN